MKNIYPVLFFLLMLVGIIQNANAQQIEITGKVTDASDGMELPGVNIVEKGSHNGTLTDASGNYAIQVSSGATLVFSFVGYDNMEVEVIQPGPVNVSLITSLHELLEVVVVGYGEQKKEDLTGAVTSIGAKDFNKGVMSSPQDMLVGRMAGVQVTTNNGAPGSGATIRIRGGSSMSASNDPLIVIDGFPVDNSAISGLPNTLASINPNDIESVTVLKDASSTAIYGSRASNGVIIITTKKGESGTPKLNYSGQVSVSSPIEFVDVFGADEYRQLVQDLNERGESGLSTDALNRLGDANTNWQEEIFRDAISHNHNLSVSGTTQKIPYRLSYGFTDEQGILKTTELKRHTVNLNVTPTFLDGDLNVNANAKLMYSKSNFGNTGAVGAAVSFDPTQPIRNGNDRFGGYFTWVNLSDVLADGSMDPNGDPNPIGSANPVSLLEQTDNRSVVGRMITNLAIDYRLRFFPDLKIHVNGGLDLSKGDGYNYAPDNAAWTFRNGVGQKIDYENENSSELLDIYLNYTKDLNQHSFDATAGYSWQHFKREGFNFSRNGNQEQVSDNSTYINENYLVSFFGRLNYSFNSKYLVTATLRTDGSSRFSEENRWGLFPALALAWKIDNENFLLNSPVVSDLKLRFGYGITGQQDIGSNYYPYLPIYRESTATARYQFGNQFYNTLRPDPYDANLKWEETTTYNIGVDFGFLQDRIYGSFDVYKRETNDLINFIPIAEGSNFSNFLTTNVGNLENKGFEFTLNVLPINRPQFTWNLGFNLTYNENTITKLTKTDDPDYPGVSVGGISGGVGNTVQNNKVGFPVNSFYLFQQVYGHDGNPIEGLYVDQTGNGGSVTSDNLNKLHYQNPAPEYAMGINSNVNYKDFTFSFSSRINLRNYVYNNVNSSQAIYSAVYNQSGFFNNIPRAVNLTGFSDPQYWSDFYLENASFFKMDNMSIGYNFEKFLVDKLKANLSFTVQNAFTITDYSGIDPEVDGGIDNNIYPRPRVFLMGINLTY